MSNAGSALMGIGRASGDNRAVEAAEQAIESPLLEVSIDGARGILFNVIGGMDMSMHEINAAAEAITSAADPSANIIFGATINPDLEGEMIITVIATGFDASYFTTRATPSEAETPAVRPAPQSAYVASSHHSTSHHAAEPAAQPENQASQHGHHTTHHTETPERDIDVSSLDMELDKEEADLFTKEADQPAQASIWSAADDDEDDDDDAATTTPRPMLADKEDEIDKPSFLRRLRKRQDESEG